MQTRSKDLLCTIGKVEFFKREVLNLTILQQLPSHIYFYERYLTMQSEYENDGRKNGKIITDLVNEFVYIWTHMNIPFLAQSTIRSKFSKLIAAFVTLKKTHKSKRGNVFYSKLEGIEKDLDVGMDIFSHERKDHLKTELGIEYGKEEQDLYEDNCKRNEGEVCPRTRWCGGTCQVWLKKAKERKRKLERKNFLKAWELERYRLLMENERIKLAELNESADFPDNTVERKMSWMEWKTKATKNMSRYFITQESNCDK